MGNAVCTVCHEGSSKYKCPACKSSSCSLACFKTHKATCFLISTDRVQSTSAIATVEADRQSDQAAHDFIDRTKLDALFLTYPGLRRQLRDIYASTLDPVQKKPSDREHNRPNPPSDFRVDRGWNPEKGFSRGLTSIRSALDTGIHKSEGLEQFLDLVVESRNVV